MKRTALRFAIAVTTLAISLRADFALAAAGMTKIISYYELLLQPLFSDPHVLAEWTPVLAGLVSTLIILALGLSYSRAAATAGLEIAPSPKFSIPTVIEMILEFLVSLAKDIIGAGSERYLPLLASLFIFIFVSNLSGLVPGFQPATESLNTNLAMGLVVFFSYHIAGVREHGKHYINQFLGPVLWMAPLMFLIELVAHLARPVSLSLRLYGNIFGDHLVLSVFTGLTMLVLPAFLLFFGLLVASLQSFVFTLLSGIYISMAVSHDH